MAGIGIGMALFSNLKERDILQKELKKMENKIEERDKQLEKGQKQYNKTLESILREVKELKEKEIPKIGVKGPEK